MATTTLTTAQADVYAFAAQFPTANVQRAVALCEAGVLTWEQVADLFAKSLRQGLDEVR